MKSRFAAIKGRAKARRAAGDSRTPQNNLTTKEEKFMKKVGFMVAVAAAMVSSVTASEWEISVGGAFRPGIKGDFNVVSPYSMSVPSYSPTYSATKAEAMAAASAKTDASGKLVFDGGFIDPNDSAGIAGETWNWKIDDASKYNEANQRITISSGYSESSYSFTEGGLSVSGEEDLSGISIGLGRSLWENEKFGVGLNIGASFYDDVELLSCSGSMGSGSASITEGVVETTIATPDAWVGEPYLVKPDGSMGTGTFDGPGPVLSYDPATGLNSLVTTYTEETSYESVSKSLIANVQGDYSSYDLYATIEPYWEASEWLRLNARLGLGIVSSEFDASATFTENGKSVWAGSESFDDTAVCAIVGVGAGVNITERLFIRAAADWYLGMDDMEIDGTFVQGKIERGDFVWRAEVGVRF